MMVMKRTPLRLFPIILLWTGMALSGCSGASPATTGAPASAAASQPAVSTGTIPATTPVPTATEPPAAARVNGQPVLLSDFQAELGRYQSAQGEASSLSEAEQSQKVLATMIDQLLLAQAAQKAGHTLDDAALDARIQELSNQLGDGSALAGWQEHNGYTPESFRSALRIELLVAWQRDQIAALVPQTADQVHARQILLLDEALANSVHTKLDNGSDFATLARKYDPVTAGELGWFPQGYLTQPDVDAAAFALQPGAYSAVIHTDLGYHILQVIERDPVHPLSPEARRMMQEHAVQDWLKQQRAASQIEVLLP